jgi:ketosteroid isomerase-like protein
MADNVKLIRDCFDAFGRGDPAFIVARVAKDVDWRHAGGPEIPYGGAYKGPDGVGQFFTKIGASLDVLTWEPKHVLAAGDEVVATGTWSAKAKSTGRHGIRRARRPDHLVPRRRGHRQGRGGLPLRVPLGARHSSGASCYVFWTARILRAHES